jgi:hypothetical protein
MTQGRRKKKIRQRRKRGRSQIELSHTRWAAQGVAMHQSVLLHVLQIHRMLRVENSRPLHVVDLMPTLNFSISLFIAGIIVVILLTYKIVASCVLGLEVQQNNIHEERSPKKKDKNVSTSRLPIPKATIMTINQFGFC